MFCGSVPHQQLLTTTSGPRYLSRKSNEYISEGKEAKRFLRCRLRKSEVANRSRRFSEKKLFYIERSVAETSSNRPKLH